MWRAPAALSQHGAPASRDTLAAWAFCGTGVRGQSVRGWPGAQEWRARMAPAPRVQRARWVEHLQHMWALGVHSSA